MANVIITYILRPERGIWTDIFAVVPSRQDTKRFCYNWIKQESKLNVSLLSSEDVPPCPCTLQQALMDTARYQPDPDCNNLMDNKDPDLNCLYRASARHCIRLGKPRYVTIWRRKKQVMYYIFCFILHVFQFQTFLR